MFLKLLFVFSSLISFTNGALEPWHYKCDEYNRCVRDGLASKANNPLGLTECKWKCDPHGLLFPRPRSFAKGQYDPDDINLDAYINMNFPTNIS